MKEAEKAIVGLEECYRLLDCIGTQEECKKLVLNAIDALKEQEAEIAFLKAMQLQTVHNMSDEDIGNAVRNVLRL